MMRRRLQQLVEALRAAQAAARQRALRDEAQRALRDAKRRYGFPMDAGRES